MKVNDLTMTSISAKKAALGIPTFNVQIVTGYDSKFHSLLDATDTSNLQTQWTNMWKEVWKDATVTVSPFDSRQLSSWITSRDKQMIVFGQKLLAAKIWSDLLKEQRLALHGRLPTRFLVQMEKLSTTLDFIMSAATITQETKVSISGSDAQDDSILNLSRIVSPIYLKGVQCTELKCLADIEGFRDMAALLFGFQCEDIIPEVHVPYFDALYSEIAKSGHPMASILFGRKWLIILRPRSDLPVDLQAWCWGVLRDGFNNTNASTT